MFGIPQTDVKTGYHLLSVLSLIADKATDALIDEAICETHKCGAKNCRICPANRKLLEVLRELREIRTTQKD